MSSEVEINGRGWPFLECRMDVSSILNRDFNEMQGFLKWIIMFAMVCYLVIGNVNLRRTVDEEKSNNYCLAFRDSKIVVLSPPPTIPSTSLTNSCTEE